METMKRKQSVPRWSSVLLQSAGARVEWSYRLKPLQNSSRQRTSISTTILSRTSYFLDGKDSTQHLYLHSEMKSMGEWRSILETQIMLTYTHVKNASTNRKSNSGDTNIWFSGFTIKLTLCAFEWQGVGKKYKNIDLIYVLRQVFWICNNLGKVQ